MEQNKLTKENEEPRLKLEDDVSFMNEQPVASSMECTGLMPSLPATEDEAENYSNIYSVPTPRQIDDPEIRKKPLRHHKIGGNKT
ncbi:hypothetical protein [Caproicibacter sp.]|uniref:hypothetical protein n=1 Tax=Caproicibacter sp. TaxID=2814884 RepID=UPI003988D46D